MNTARDLSKTIADQSSEMSRPSRRATQMKPRNTRNRNDDTRSWRGERAENRLARAL
jgi:hypothetical protein